MVLQEFATIQTARSLTTKENLFNFFYAIFSKVEALRNVGTIQDRGFDLKQHRTYCTTYLVSHHTHYHDTGSQGIQS